MALLCNDVSHWLGENLEAALIYHPMGCLSHIFIISKLHHWQCLITMGYGVLPLIITVPADTLTLNGVNTLRLRQNGRCSADDIFKCIFLSENVWILIKISLKFVSKGPISNIPALVEVMAWHQSRDKPLSGPMLVRLPTHICITPPQGVNHQQTECWPL